MQIIQQTTQFKLLVPSAVALGKFDGLHRGHKKLLEKVIEAKNRGLSAVVFTFEPPPEVFFGLRDRKELTTREEKRKIFRKMGVDVLIEYPLNRETAATPPGSFVTEVLLGRLGMAYLAAGEDVSFGCKGAGDAKLLASMAQEFGFFADLLEKVSFQGRVISSTYVREEVGQGHMERVEELLGEPYAIAGEIVHGAKLGRSIGMPTINLLPEPEKLLPPKGVYYSQTKIGGKTYKSITNIGSKPTVSKEGALGVETYIYEFGQEVYGKEALVRLLSFKRPERKFDSLSGLRGQLMEDIEEGRGYHR